MALDNDNVNMQTNRNIEQPHVWHIPIFAGKQNYVEFMVY